MVLGLDHAALIDVILTIADLLRKEPASEEDLKTLKAYIRLQSGTGKTSALIYQFPNLFVLSVHILDFRLHYNVVM